MIKVGCCGYPVAMGKYYENFPLVELNTTFYRYPKMSTVAKWREKAPVNFEFSVKAHQDISHNYRLKPQKPCLEAFKKMKKICKTLNAQILLVQTPASFKPGKLNDARKFFTKIDRENLKLVWETRGSEWEPPIVRRKLAEALKAVGITHVTDPLRILPAYTQDIAYFRLHGLGKRLYYYQHSDEELKELAAIVRHFEAEGKDVYVLFNNLAMFEDGIRFSHYLKTRKFRSITGATGKESIKIVLRKTRYPTSKTLLMKRVGWKLVEPEKGKTARLSELLKDLPPSKTYENAEQVLKDLKLEK